MSTVRTGTAPAAMLFEGIGMVAILTCWQSFWS